MTECLFFLTISYVEGNSCQVLSYAFKRTFTYTPMVPSEGFLFQDTVGRVWRQSLVVIVRRVILAASGGDQESSKHPTYPTASNCQRGEVEKPCSILTRIFI